MTTKESPVSAEQANDLVRSTFKLAVRLAVDHCSELWNEGRHADDVIANLCTDFLEESMDELRATAASGVKGADKTFVSVPVETLKRWRHLADMHYSTSIRSAIDELLAAPSPVQDHTAAPMAGKGDV